MIHRATQHCSRALAAAVTCALILQAFVAVFETALAFGRAAGGEAFAICHGEGTGAPASGDEDGKPPCALCTLATGGALPAAPIAVTAARLPGRELVGCREAIAVATPAPARAGLSRAPPARG